MKEMLYYSVVTFVVLHRVLVISHKFKKMTEKPKHSLNASYIQAVNIFQNTLLNEIFNNNKFKKYIYLKTKQKQE